MLKLTCSESKETIFVNASNINGIRANGNGSVIDMGVTVYYVSQSVEQVLNTKQVKFWSEWT